MRFSLLALLVLGLVGCDALGGSSDDVTGTWTGEVSFVADTLLTGPAVRIEYDMVERLELRLIHEDGLVRGTVTRTGGGTKVFRSATGVRDSSDVADREPISHDLFGTFVEGDDRLQLQVMPRWTNHPLCGTETVPYSDGLLTFEVSGSRGESAAYISLLDAGVGSDGEPFSLTVRSDERLSIDRDASEAPTLASVISDPGEENPACRFDGGDLRTTTSGAPAVELGL